MNRMTSCIFVLLLGSLCLNSFFLTRAHAVEPGVTVDSLEVRKFYNVRFNESNPEDQTSAGLADLYVPISADDVIGDDASEVPATPPIQVTGKPRPAILLVHGGGWISGDKWTLGSYCDDLSNLGFVVLNINYRLAPSAKFPAQLDDVREGLRYLTNHAVALSIDINRIGMYGYSAGGHLSALIGVLGDESSETITQASDWPADDPRWDELPRVAAVCAGGPPCDFRVMPLDNETFSYFLKGPRRAYPDLYAAASPTAHASVGDPPFQIIHGENDMIVPLETSQKFVAALREAGASVDLKVIKNHGHVLTLLHPGTRSGVVDFFRQQFLSGAEIADAVAPE